MTQANVYASIVKMDENPDGTLTVFGKATDDSLDIDQQICDPVWLDRAMPEWFVTGGNIREQHSNIAAGVAEEYQKKADGHYITALVVDPVSVKKVKTRVLKGFSIGIKSPRVVKDNKAVNGRIIDGQIVEVSLVDRPANPNAKLVLAKSVESEESLVKTEELIEKQYGETAEQETAEGPMVGGGQDAAQHELEETKALTTNGCDCEGCKMCKESGGCNDIMCKGHHTEKELVAEDGEEEMKSATNKCLECGCNMVGTDHGGGMINLPDGTQSHMTTAVMSSPDQMPVGSPVMAPPTPKSVDTITPLPTIETVGTQIEEEDSDEQDSADKSLLADVNITDIVEKAVKSAMATIEAQVAELKSAKEAVENKASALESELATAKSLAVNSGPKRTTIATGANKTNEWQAKASLYQAKAAATSDPILAKGYRDLAKDFLAKANNPQAE